VDFLAAEHPSGVLSQLIAEALAEFKRNGAAAVSCYASNPRCRRVLLRQGFFPVPRRDPIHFIRLFSLKRADLRKFPVCANGT